ncbi:TPA: peptidoglycan-binding protein, partial [Legionella pneumophila]|nr:peptidoglycan-binding protein [Legionella pneumophila]
ATQNWLNENYSNVNGFDPVPTNGKTGWSTVYGLTKALQHELGITTLVDSFGPSTAQKYKEFGELSPGFIGQSRKEIAIITILQGAMYCKGYDPGAFRDGVFSNYMGQSVAKLQNDAGLSVQDGKVYDYIFKAFLTMDAYKLTLNGDPGTRTIQQELNRKYYKTSGVQPCDGHYQRGTNRALIYGIQTEIGIAPSSQTGAIGPATKAGLPTLKVGQTSPFVKLFQFA